MSPAEIRGSNILMKLRFLPATIFCFLITLSVFGQTNASPQLEKHFSTEVKVRINYDYLLFLPEGYAKSRKRWPLMLFLHGAGESGTNVLKIKKLGPPMLVDSNRDFPFILVSPQSQDRSWNPDALNALLDDVIHNYRVDKDRVYLTGPSMGGTGTWTLASAHPEKFAAIAPVSSGGETGDLKKLLHMPIWAFHGAKDPTVKVSRIEATVAAFRAAGSDIRLTIYPDAVHDVWTQAYSDPELYQWLLAHKRHY
jgi:predicted peptidase